MQPKFAAQRWAPRVADGATIQRMEAAATVRLTALQGGYLDLYNCLAAYCPLFIGEHNVYRKLQIGQALGCAAPEHTGHHSQPGGDDSNAPRATANQAHFRTWWAANSAAVNGAVVAEAGPPQTTEKHHSKAEEKVAAKKKVDKKAAVANAKHDRFHANPANWGKLCYECNRRVF